MTNYEIIKNSPLRNWQLKLLNVVKAAIYVNFKTATFVKTMELTAQIVNLNLSLNGSKARRRNEKRNDKHKTEVV